MLERAAVLHSIVTALILEHDGNVVEREFKVIDLFSKEKAEFLKAIDLGTNETVTLRLDHLVQLGDGNSTYLTDRC
jgi:glycosyltransferase A (GT-A) superfamily protein (DUF2064 family)